MDKARLLKYVDVLDRLEARLDRELDNNSPMFGEVAQSYALVILVRMAMEDWAENTDNK